VRRFRSREDERILEVEITDKGEQLRDRALAIPQAVAGCVKLDTEEAMELYRLLYKVLASMKEE